MGIRSDQYILKPPRPLESPGVLRVCQILADPERYHSSLLPWVGVKWRRWSHRPLHRGPVAFAAVSVVEPECEKSSATTYFWYREALDISNSISESGGLNWKMTLCLLVAWGIVGMAVVKGIQSSGKVSGCGGHPHLHGGGGAAEKCGRQGWRTLGRPCRVLWVGLASRWLRMRTQASEEVMGAS